MLLSRTLPTRISVLVCLFFLFCYQCLVLCCFLLGDAIWRIILYPSLFKGHHGLNLLALEMFIVSLKLILYIALLFCFLCKFPKSAPSKDFVQMSEGLT